MTVLGSKLVNSGRRTQARRESVLIEIGDEAYKQNTVYRPWHEIVPTTADADPETPPNRPKTAATSG
ncbi:MAG: hypothetical protein R3228_14135 [Halioglobus sp.]|nr:hypothetical protein [Halioglobus sp.]